MKERAEKEKIINRRLKKKERERGLKRKRVKEKDILINR